MWLFVWLALGFQDSETVQFTVRNYFRVTVKAVNGDEPKPINGSFRLMLLTDHVELDKSKKMAMICLDDVGYITPVGCVVEVAADVREVNTVTGRFKCPVVIRKDQIRVMGIGPIEIPEMTVQDRQYLESLKRREENLRGGPKRPPVRNNTGVVLPGGKP